MITLPQKRTNVYKKRVYQIIKHEPIIKKSKVKICHEEGIKKMKKILQRNFNRVILQ